MTGEARYPADVPVANPAYAFLVTSAIATRPDHRARPRRGAGRPGRARHPDPREHGRPDQAARCSRAPAAASAPRSSRSGRDQRPARGPDRRGGGRRHLRGGARGRLQGPRRPTPRRRRPRPSTRRASSCSRRPRSRKGIRGSAGRRRRGRARRGRGRASRPSTRTPTQHHNPIELFATTCAWQGEQLTVYEPSQFVYGLKNGVAAAARHRPGGRPRRQHLCRRRLRLEGHADAAHGADRAGGEAAEPAGEAGRRPATRASPSRPTAPRRATASGSAPTRDGRLTAYSHEGWEVSSRPDGYIVGGTEATSRLYAAPNVVDQASTSSTPTATRRASCARRRRCPTSSRSRRAMDELAVKLGMDPIELRRHQRHHEGADQRRALSPAAR